MLRLVLVYVARLVTFAMHIIVVVVLLLETDGEREVVLVRGEIIGSIYIQGLVTDNIHLSQERTVSHYSHLASGTFRSGDTVKGVDVRSLIHGLVVPVVLLVRVVCEDFPVLHRLDLKAECEEGGSRHQGCWCMCRSADKERAKVR